MTRQNGATEAQIDYCACQDPDGCRKYGCPFQYATTPPNGWSASVAILVVMAAIGGGVMYAALQLLQLLQDLVR